MFKTVTQIVLIVLLVYVVVVLYGKNAALRAQQAIRASGSAPSHAQSVATR